MIEESYDIENEISNGFENSELTKEALALIEEMRLKHEAEIHFLSEQLKLEPEFIKNIMKYQREPAPRKKRKISAYNVFQKDWWENNKTKDYNLSTADIQKVCASDWKKLNEKDHQFYKEKVKEISDSQQLSSINYIENTKSRMTVLNKGISDIRKMFCSLQITCGQEFVTLSVSNRNELGSSFFGTNAGEEFYRNTPKFKDFITPFRSLSNVKYNEYIGIFAKQSSESNNNYVDENNMEIDINKANTKEVQNMVRKVLKSKFERDVKCTQIPYKNWHIQNKYAVKNWPDNITFQDYSNIKNENNRKKVLLALKDIEFVKLG
ncbi:hypothetical protein C1646_818068 [Rhizophagus diaphanus]|nr:hypothetical protein C1646_818068 [Rhizophagus diaphanus] [Rhizophagus sp. MUCL 43196]